MVRIEQENGKLVGKDSAGNTIPVDFEALNIDRIIDANLPVSYLVKDIGGTVYADSQRDGFSDFSGSNPATVINSAVDQHSVDDGGTIALCTDITISSTILIDKDDVAFVGHVQNDRHPQIHLADGADTNMIEVSGGHCVVKNLLLEGNGSNQSGTSKGIKWTGKDPLLKEVYTNKTSDQGLHVANTGTWANVDHVFAEGAQGGEAFLIESSRGAYRHCNAFQPDGGQGWDIVGFRNTFQACYTRGRSDGSTLEGFHVRGDLNRFFGCSAHDNNPRRAFNLVGSRNDLHGCQAKDIDRAGLRFAGSYNRVFGGTLRDCCKAANDTYDAIRIKSGNDHNRLFGVDIYTDNATNKPKYGVHIQGGEDNKLIDVTIENAQTSDINDAGTRTVVNGRYFTPPTLSLGGSNGEIAPTDTRMQHYHLKVDAGGSNSDLQGINSLKKTGVRVTLIHTGGENVVLKDDSGSASSGAALKHQSGSDVTLDANGEIVQYEYNGSEWREVYNNVQA